MNDFIADLEAELVGAARRRVTRRGLPRVRLVPVIAVAAAAFAAILVVATLDRSQTADDRPTPPAGPSIAVTLAPALRAEETSRCPQLGGWTAYAPGEPTLAVFARPKAGEDAPPAPVDWLHAAVVDTDNARRVADDLWLVPVMGLDCDDGQNALDSGVCLVVESGPVARCFSDSEISAGKAVARIGRDKVAGIVLDGITGVSVDGVTARVADNAFEATVPGVGDHVRVQLSGERRTCGPSPQAYAAVPALERPPTGNPTRELEVLMAAHGHRGAWRDSARQITTREGMKIWVVADEPCDRPSQHAEQVCLLAEHGVLACETPANIRRHGLVVKFKDGEFWIVAGIAPVGTTSARMWVHDLVLPMRFVGRVYGGALQALPGEPVHVRLR